MAKRRRRRMHYYASVLHDGTVLGTYPIRKPSARMLKRDHQRIDTDGVAMELPRNGSDLRDTRNETRFRFQDLIAAKLNTRRAIRELVLPVLAEIDAELRRVAARLERIERASRRS